MLDIMEHQLLALCDINHLTCLYNIGHKEWGDARGFTFEK